MLQQGVFPNAAARRRPLDQHCPPGGIVETRDQVDQRRLARARAAQDGDSLAGLGAEADIFEHRQIRIAVVVEIHSVETHRRLPLSPGSGCASAASITSGSASRTSLMRLAEASPLAQVLESCVIMMRGFIVASR